MIDPKIREFIRQNLETSLSLDGTSSVPRTRRGLQHFVSIKPKDLLLRQEYELIISNAVQAEQMCPQSGIFFLKRCAGLTVHKKDKIRTKTQMLEELSKNSYSKLIFSLLKEVIELSDKNSRISLKKSSGKAFVEHSLGYNFSLPSLIKFPPSEIKFSKVLCIDGYIESVHEIHHILTSLSEEKVPCFLFCRGMSEDVSYTLKVNNDRKTLLIFPFVVPFNVEEVNTIVDLATVSGTDVISSTKGNLISSINTKDFGSFYDVVVTPGSIRAKNLLTKQRVEDHIRGIKKIMSERPELSDTLSKRVKSLSSSCIDICIPDGIDYYSNSQQIDEGIRIISSIFNNSYDPEEVSGMFYRSFKETFVNTKLFTHC